MNPTNNPQLVGLAYDAVGILILGAPAAHRMVREVAAQSGTYWDENPHFAKALSEGRIDVTVGSLILFAGFSCQLVGMLGYYYKDPIGFWLCTLSAAFLVFYFLTLRGFLSGMLLRRVTDEIARSQAR